MEAMRIPGVSTRVLVAPRVTMEVFPTMLRVCGPFIVSIVIVFRKVE
jgi:hypothetical protein